jgi:hypothetical protein
MVAVRKGVDRLGDMVGKTAAAGTITADLDATYEKAKARGAKWFELAERMIGGPIKMKETIAERLRAAQAELRPIRKMRSRTS